MKRTLSHDQPEVSVLVPIYNSEEHLAACLDSISAQTLQSMEVICINDGSSDRSSEIVERSANLDPRIVIINKGNSGYGDSLNLGLERARGVFVGILESDDFVEPRMYKKLFALATNNGADIVKSDFYNHADGVSTRANIIPANNAGRLIEPSVDHEILKAQPSVWSAIYACTFLKKNGIQFTDTPGASFQDTAFNLKALTVSDKVWLTRDAFVHYRRDNLGSSIHSNDKVFTVCDEYDNFERFMLDYPEKMSMIAGPLQAIKFETYSWNLSRLSGQAQLDFYNKMYRDFTLLEEIGPIRYEYFPNEDIPLLKLLLTGNPDFVQRSIQARSIKFGRTTLK